MVGNEQNKRIHINGIIAGFSYYSVQDFKHETMGSVLLWNLLIKFIREAKKVYYGTMNYCSHSSRSNFPNCSRDLDKYPRPLSRCICLIPAPFIIFFFLFRFFNYKSRSIQKGFIKSLVNKARVRHCYTRRETGINRLKWSTIPSTKNDMIDRRTGVQVKWSIIRTMS